MNVEKRNEELLREAAASGDEEVVRALIDSGVCINAQHTINGWTALHWAAKRGHSSIVHYLLSKGADPKLTSVYGETALSLSRNEDVRQTLTSICSENSVEVPKLSLLPITANYLANPPLNPNVDLEYKGSNYSTSNGPMNKYILPKLEELVLKVRTSDPSNQDFIEIEIPLDNLSYENVLKTCCEELEVGPQQVLKLRKLPNTILRKDKDVLRLHNFQELELVIKSNDSNANTELKTKPTNPSTHEINGYVASVNQTTDSNLLYKSNYCKNGTLLY